MIVRLSRPFGQSRCEPFTLGLRWWETPPLYPDCHFIPGSASRALHDFCKSAVRKVLNSWGTTGLGFRSALNSCLKLNLRGQLRHRVVDELAPEFRKVISIFFIESRRHRFRA
jgi:hypothetical protein